MARLMETMVGKPFSEITDDQIDQLVDMGLDYNRAVIHSMIVIQDGFHLMNTVKNYGLKMLT